MRSSTVVVVRSEVKYLLYRSLEYTIHDFISNLTTIHVPTSLENDDPPYVVMASANLAIVVTENSK